MAALFINGYYGFWPWFFGGSILWGIIGLVIASTKGRSGWGCCLGCLLGPFGLLLTMLMHAAVNNTKDIVPSAVAGATNPFALSTSPAGVTTRTTASSAPATSSCSGGMLARPVCGSYWNCRRCSRRSAAASTWCAKSSRMRRWVSSPTATACSFVSQAYR